MPNNRRRTRQAQSETPAQNDPAVTSEPIPESGPVEGAVLEHGVGETPAAAAVAEDGGHEEQTASEVRNAAEAAEEGQNAGEGNAVEEQAATEAPASTGELQSGLPMTVQIHSDAPVEDVVATADVTLGDVCTIRNVKIKEDDYGLKVVMPRTRMPDTGRFKDACYFHSAELREQFDAAVKDAYRQTLEPAQEQGGMDGMTM